MKLRTILCLLVMSVMLAGCGDDGRTKHNDTKMTADKLKELQEKSALRQNQELSPKSVDKK